MGVAEEIGKNVKSVKVGDQIGVPWLGGCCGDCIYCKEGKENLCDKAMCVFWIAFLTILDIRATKRMADLLITVLQMLLSVSLFLLITLLSRQLPYFVPD